MVFEDILSNYDEKIAILALHVRNLLLKELKSCSEIPDKAAAVIGYGYGTGYKDLICTILLSKKGVKLGFYKGAELSDPDHLLSGKGKVHRYAEIRSIEDLVNPALKHLIRLALKAHKERKLIG